MSLVKEYIVILKTSVSYVFGIELYKFLFPLSPVPVQFDLLTYLVIIFFFHILIDSLRLCIINQITQEHGRALCEMMIADVDHLAVFIVVLHIRVT